jgi:hypothetical protein
MYQNIVGAFKDEKQELLDENEMLRETIARYDNELIHLKNQLQRSGVRSPVSINFLKMYLKNVRKMKRAN